MLASGLSLLLVGVWVFSPVYITLSAVTLSNTVLYRVALLRGFVVRKQNKKKDVLLGQFFPVLIPLKDFSIAETETHRNHNAAHTDGIFSV